MLKFKPERIRDDYKEYEVVQIDENKMRVGKVIQYDKAEPIFEPDDEHWYTLSLSEIQQLADFMRTLC